MDLDNVGALLCTARSHPDPSVRSTAEEIEQAVRHLRQVLGPPRLRRDRHPRLTPAESRETRRAQAEARVKARRETVDAPLRVHTPKTKPVKKPNPGQAARQAIRRAA